MNVTEKSTKAELIEGAYDYIDHVERTMFNRKQALILCCIAFVLGLAA